MPRTGSDVGPSRAVAPRRAFIHRRLVAAAVAIASATFAIVGCTSVLDIDDDYVLESSQSPSGGSGSGTATGGKASTGGASSGGALASGGAESGGAVGNPNDVPDAACVDGTACTPDTMCCGGMCVARLPIVGCGNPDCKPCPMPPESGTIVCGGIGECAIKCNLNFQLVANSVCEPVQSNTGGTTGGGGAPATGGAPPVGCDAKLCPGCGAPGPFGCCKNDNVCGCSWTPSGSGYCL